MTSTTPLLLDIIGKAEIYRMLNKEQRAALADSTRPMRLRRRTIFIQEGDLPDGVYWIVYGQVRIACSVEGGQEKTIAVLGSNKCFGLTETLANSAYLSFAITTEDTMLLHTHRDAILEAAEHNFEFAQELMARASRQMISLLADAKNSLRRAPQRLADYLLRQMRLHSSATFELATGKALVAARLNFSPETMSRLLRDLEGTGAVLVEDRQVTILDHIGLKRWAEENAATSAWCAPKNTAKPGE